MALYLLLLQTKFVKLLNLVEFGSQVVYPELNLFKLFWMLICIQVVYPGQINYASTWFILYLVA